MVRSTTIFRVHDALPLAASVDDESTEKALTEYKQQSKLIFRRLNANSEPACSIESGAYTLHYLIVDKVIYMCICDNSYPRKLAFSYLDELSKEFQRSYGDKIDGATRPYAFMGFDTFIGKTTRLYRDSRSLTQGGGPAGSNSRLDQLNENLKDVTQIMTKNMEDLLWRGDSLDRMSQLSTSLRSESAKYRKAARNINLEALIRKWAPIGGIGFLFILFIWWRFF
ncbi:vesicle transporter SEC22 [Cryptococcus neoformans]|nr:vesicle transporter SEC22 [Cryptococcus neoformans var. grubii Th84]OXH11807.1 vesicle transporter SEC22 [Cryptococcus neoformans var. grubii]OXH32715.1 vesicle transporter SEC22 [Cryptococcus neoformans var. grubii]OXH53088.1 vesicle transporter SEC22 [Cryptococcus neoformans var. grubii]OXH53224.1 vesicle transporter SEC22 [Cryptococcus neoformans var. grubii]